jgi:hypothetical protein
MTAQEKLLVRGFLMIVHLKRPGWLACFAREHNMGYFLW